MLLEYGVRNLWARRRYVVPTVAAIAATASAVVMLFSVASSMEKQMIAGSPLPNMVVLHKGSMLENASSFSLEEAGEIKAAPGLATTQGVPQVSAEYVGALFVTQLEPRRPALVRIRGVDPVALDVHSQVRLVSGRIPRHGERAVAVGRALLGRYENITESGGIRLGRDSWPVVGVLESGDELESEIWADRAMIMDEFRHPTISVAYATLSDAGQRADFADRVGRVKGLEAITEAELGRRRLVWTSMDQHIRTLRWLCALLSLGAMVAALNALHGSLQSRLGELATLRALGYTRARVLALGLLESSLIAFAAAVLGLPFAWAIDGQTFFFGMFHYQAHVDLSAVSAGTAAIAAIALLSGTFGAMQLRRMDVLSTLRRG